jgi:hypothetical protein
LIDVFSAKRSNSSPPLHSLTARSDDIAMDEWNTRGQDKCCLGLRRHRRAW